MQINNDKTIDDIIMEAIEINSKFVLTELYPSIENVLKTPVGDRKFKQLCGNFIDRNSEKLHTAGPLYMIPFGDIDKGGFFNLFNLKENDVKTLIKKIVKQISQSSDFKLLTNNPIYWVFYCVIRFYKLKKDEKGLNSALAIYALSNYPMVFSMSFPHEPNAGVMQYTMDHLSEKYLMKQAGHLFGGLFLSIKHSYAFLNSFIDECYDKEVIRFIQRIRNDQKSMIKNICDQYMKNHRAGLRVSLSKNDNNDEMGVDVDRESNSTLVDTISNNIVTQIITSGLDLRRVTYCKEIAGIGLSDCRFYLSKIVTVKYTEDIRDFIHAILFLFLYDEKKKREDINSSYFLSWSIELFRKTNSNNANIKCIKDTLNKWGEETGVHAKFKREPSRVNYKKSIFWYFILSIQYYNK